MSVTELDVKVAVKRVADIWKSVEVEPTVKAWLWVMKDDPTITRGDLLEAVREYVSGDSHYAPKPGPIRTAARRLAMERTGGAPMTDRPHYDGVTCPHCGQTLRLLEPHEQKAIYQDEDGRWREMAYPPSRASRYGIMHDLRQPHPPGCPITYGRYFTS